MISQLEHPPIERGLGGPSGVGGGHVAHIRRAHRIRLEREPLSSVEGYCVEWQMDTPPPRREGAGHPRAAGGRTA